VAAFLARRFPEGSQRRIVTGVFAMSVDHPTGNPGRRMEEVGYLHEALEEVQPEIMAANMRQLVKQDPGKRPSW